MVRIKRWEGLNKRRGCRRAERGVGWEGRKVRLDILVRCKRPSRRVRFVVKMFALIGEGVEEDAELVGFGKTPNNRAELAEGFRVSVFDGYVRDQRGVKGVIFRGRRSGNERR